MIDYDVGTFGLFFILQYRGSVFPKSFLMALPSAGLAALLHIYARGHMSQPDHSLMSMSGVNFLWAGYTSVLSLLIVFRNNQAYTRFWEGASLISQLRAQWFDAASTVICFCNKSEDYGEKVQQFQKMIVRLFSLLYCSALQQVCDMHADDRFEIIECHGLNAESLEFLHGAVDRCEVISHWIQQLVVEADDANVIKIAPPLLTRFFQELSTGNVILNNARKIKDIPFPFPYAQLVTVMMIFHWIATPIVASQVIDSPLVASCMTFLVTFVLWCLVYITMEIDQPFGEDDNDLPLRNMQKEFNASLLTLLHPLQQKCPEYNEEVLCYPISESDDGGSPMGRKSSLDMVMRVTQDAASSALEGMAEACSMTSESLAKHHQKKGKQPQRQKSKDLWNSVGKKRSRRGSLLSFLGERSPSKTSGEGDEDDHPLSRSGSPTSKEGPTRSAIPPSLARLDAVQEPPDRLALKLPEGSLAAPPAPSAPSAAPATSSAVAPEGPRQQQPPSAAPQLHPDQDRGRADSGGATPSAKIGDSVSI